MTDPKTSTVPSPETQVDEKAKATPVTEPMTQPAKSAPEATPAKQS